MSPSGERSLAPTAKWRSVPPLALRRALFTFAVVLTLAGLTLLLVRVLSVSRPGIVAVLMAVAFFVNGIWVTLVFWNAIIGFALRRLMRRPALAGWPELAGVPAEAPLSLRTAVVMTMRNENAGAVFTRLGAVKRSLDAGPWASRFDYFLLSDSNEPDAIADEERAAAAWRMQDADIAERVIYRRRDDNRGYKPGNVREFCARWGADYAFMVLLDADSLMTGRTIENIARIMEHMPQLGILQTLNVGIQPPSPFARLYEFGHRHVARCATLGAAWWQGDRCQFWGHNAIVRLAPFVRHCEMPHLPGRGPFSGHVLCHDQIEASFMHRAGYEVRVLAEETGSFEGVPPTVVDYGRRNDRWCQGNFQNLSVARTPGLKPIDRFHMIVVAQRFLAYPMLLSFVALAAFAAGSWAAARPFPMHQALLVYALWMFLFFAPRILGLADALIAEPARYGGRLRLLAGGVFELFAAFFLVPISTVATSLFMARLPARRGGLWPAQMRDAYRFSWKDAAALLWPHTLIGAGIVGFVAVAQPSALVWFLPFAGGLVLSIPYAVLTASPKFDALATRLKLCILPEEVEMPPEIAQAITPEAG